MSRTERVISKEKREQILEAASQSAKNGTLRLLYGELLENGDVRTVKWEEVKQRVQEVLDAHNS